MPPAIATVDATGQTTRQQRSEGGRPETIEATADLVRRAGGDGIAVQVDHLVPDEVAALVARIRQDHGRLDTRVNDRTARELHFAALEMPRLVGRAVAFLAAAPQHGRWSGQSQSSGALARQYGFTDLDGSQPDCRRYIREVGGDCGRLSPTSRPVAGTPCSWTRI